ncbi:MAG: sulfoxide reductase heme-binding subunit YedZ [Gammaproteobacteria bacterium]|nr:sulfoxide reductase heme-binding subunit YedZ [Gammaproteobacteria bacterium]MCF6362202.1 sulfoxide reductase heme-binding subunit YedZ [Gammaproteobacteria bacterium]
MRYLKSTLFFACLLPLALLVWDGFHDALGANPIETITHRTGDWTLRFLLLTLAITPARRLLGWVWAVRLRRMLGLFAFFYACLHFLTYLVLDQFFDWGEIVKDIAKRPYITIGFSAFILLIPLAVTSTQAMMRRLGRRWGQLHRLAYLIATFGVLHYLWLVKADYLQPAIYAAVLVILLGMRVWWWRDRVLMAALK